MDTYSKSPERPHEQRLTQGPIGKTLLVFALPVLGSNVLQSLSASINALWVGRYLGEVGLTATANANLILFLLLGIIFGVSMAAAIMVGQAVGARDIEHAKRVVGTGISFVALFSVMLAGVGYALTGVILQLLRTPADAMLLAQDYLELIFIAIPVVNMLSFVMLVLRGAGDARTPFYFMGLAVALHVVLNPLLIIGVGPFPRMDIEGSAVATLLSQLIALIALVIVLYGRGDALVLTRRDLRYLRPTMPILRTLVAKGVPMGLQMMVISASALMLIGLVNTHGSRVAAAYGVLAQLWTYVQMPAIAAGAAVSSMAAQNIGAGHWDRVGRITRAGIYFNIALTGLLILGFMAVDRIILGWFLPMDGAAVVLSTHINMIVLWSFILLGIAMVLFGTVRAAGAVVPPLIIMAASLLLVRVTFAYGLNDLFGAEAIWWSFPMGALALLVLATGYYRFGNWRNARMMVDRPAAGEAPDTGYGLPRERASFE